MYVSPRQGKVLLHLSGEVALILFVDLPRVGWVSWPGCWEGRIV